MSRWDKLYDRWEIGRRERDLLARGYDPWAFSRSKMYAPIQTRRKVIKRRKKR